MARKKVAMKRLKEATQLKYGNVSDICRELNISRQTFYNYIDDDEEFKQFWKDAQNSIVDIASSQLMRHVYDPDDAKYMGDLNAIKFVLETWGKREGWSKRLEVTGADGAGLFSGLDPEVLEWLREQGLSAEDAMSEAAGQFNDLIRQMMVEGDSPLNPPASQGEDL